MSNNSPNFPIKTLIFDFNGLIIDDEPLHFDLFYQILREEEINLTEKEYWDYYLGYDDKGLFEAVFNKAGKKLTPKKLKDLIAKKNELYFPTLQKKLRFFPGVLEFIQEMQHRYPLALVSGALRSEIDFVVKLGQMDSCFQVIISADDTKHGKPNPEGFVLALAKLKKIDPTIRSENCLVLEDSHSGIMAAKKARMPVAALTNTYPRDQLGEADYIFDRIDEVKHLITHSFLLLPCLVHIFGQIF